MQNSTMAKDFQDKKQFKSLAKEAVSRMKHGFWEDTIKRKESGDPKIQNEISLKDKQDILKTVISKSNTEASDIEFEKKVYQLLDEDEISPIGKLMNKEQYQEMTLEERGRYVLTISNKFLKVKEKYDTEKALKEKHSRVMQTLHI